MKLLRALSIAFCITGLVAGLVQLFVLSPEISLLACAFIIITFLAYHWEDL